MIFGMSLETEAQIGVLLGIAIFAGVLKWIQYRDAKVDDDDQG